jgi:hypothetical protein
MQNESGIKSPTCILGSDIQDFANQGIERALAARQKALELTPEELDSVGGGLAISRPIVAGGIIGIDPIIIKPPVYPVIPISVRI